MPPFGKAGAAAEDAINVRVGAVHHAFDPHHSGAVALFHVFETPADDETTSTYLVIHGQGPHRPRQDDRAHGAQ